MLLKAFDSLAIFGLGGTLSDHHVTVIYHSKYPTGISETIGKPNSFWVLLLF